jgi:hypothetical protein
VGTTRACVRASFIHRPHQIDHQILVCKEGSTPACGAQCLSVTSYKLDTVVAQSLHSRRSPPRLKRYTSRHGAGGWCVCSVCLCDDGRVRVLQRPMFLGDLGDRAHTPTARARTRDRAMGSKQHCTPCAAEARRRPHARAPGVSGVMPAIGFPEEGLPDGRLYRSHPRNPSVLRPSGALLIGIRSAVTPLKHTHLDHHCLDTNPYRVAEVVRDVSALSRL